MKIYSKLITEIDNFRVDIDEQKRYIDHFKEPKDDFDRAYYHYKCRFYGSQKKFVLFLFNVAGFFASWFLLIKFYLRYLRKKNDFGTERHDAVLINNTRLPIDYTDKVPDEIHEEFRDILGIDYVGYPDNKNGFIDGEGVRFWFKLFARRPFAGYLNCNSLLHMASVTRIMKLYEPRVILCFRMEANPTASVITAYCESRGLEYICFMHGDYICGKEQSFARFSRLYIWDRVYIDIFDWSRCPKNEYRIYTPAAYRLPKSSIESPEYFMTYYCSGIDDKAVVGIKDQLKKIVDSGRKVKIRPHPRFSDVNFLKENFEPLGIPVEGCREVPLTDSVANSEYAASAFTTVQSQAYYAGTAIIVDDISNPSYYNDLKKSKNVVYLRPHRLLSEVLDSL